MKWNKSKGRDETGKRRGRKEKKNESLLFSSLYTITKCEKANLVECIFFNLNIYFFKILQCCFRFCPITMQISLNYTYTSLQSTRLGSLCYTGTSHQLFILNRQCVYVDATFSICLTVSLPDCFHVFFNITGILLCDQILFLNILFK